MSESTRCLQLDNVAIGKLHEISITVQPGEVVCLSGPSGSGKSRLLRAIADIETHDGRIQLNGEDQQTMAGHVWRRRVMMVPADSQWWFDSVGEHFPGPLPQEELSALGFDEDVTGWSVSRLSTGERQRLALLRALVLKPDALLLDEPTSNLDPERVTDMENWLLWCIRTRDMPAIWVAHDTGQIARVADRHFRLQSGRLETT